MEIVDNILQGGQELDIQTSRRTKVYCDSDSYQPTDRINAKMAGSLVSVRDLFNVLHHLFGRDSNK